MIATFEMVLIHGKSSVDVCLSKYDDSDQQWWGGFRQKSDNALKQQQLINFCKCHSWAVIISADGHESYLWSQFKIETFPIADDIVIGWRYNALDPTFHQLAVLLIIRVRSEKETPQGSQHEDGQKDEDDGSGTVHQVQSGSPTD